MVGKNSGEIRVAGTGTISRAPLGTALPTDVSTALNVAFVDLGYADNGFKVAQDLSTEEIKGWQSRETLRIVTTGLTRTFTFTLIQSSAAAVALAWGGAAIVAGTTNKYTLDLPDASGGVASGEFVIDWQDGTATQRIVIPNGALMSLPEIEFKNDGAVQYEFEVRAQVPAAGGDAVLIFGQDAAINPV